jgi:hypothetical protein
MSTRRQAIEPNARIFFLNLSQIVSHFTGQAMAAPPLLRRGFQYRAMQQIAMRQPRPLRWIEEAEAREVVTIALSEAPPLPGSPCPSRMATTWRALIGGWASAPATVAVAIDDTAPDAVVKPLRQ